MSVPFAWLTLSPPELLVLALVVLLLFGNRLPSVMRSLGQGVVEFKKGLQGVENDVKDSTNKIEEQPTKPQAKEEAKPSEAEPVQR
jgi:sec-independent protein translocase protein TatA